MSDVAHGGPPDAGSARRRPSVSLDRRSTTQSDNVPLRLAGAPHALRIEGLVLDDVYPPHMVDDDRLWHEIDRTLNAFPDRVLHWLESAPQTNEVRRSAALLPALAIVRARFNRPVEVFELGASGGLNLFADQFHLQIPNAEIGPPDAKVRLCPDWTGPTEVVRQIRTGCQDVSSLEDRIQK